MSPGSILEVDYLRYDAERMDCIIERRKVALQCIIDLLTPK